MKYKTLSHPEKWILIGIPVLFLLGACLHFSFELTGRSVLVGAIAPVNESVWEHMKMTVLPLILWWTIYYLAVGEKHSIDANRWFTAGLVSLLISTTSIPFLFYFYTQSFGVEFLSVDIAILFLALLFGQLLGLHFYQHTKGINRWICISLFVLILVLFVIFTFFPPHLPLFLDTEKGKYGMPL